MQRVICSVSFSIQLQATDLTVASGATSKGYVGMDHVLQLKQQEQHDQAATNIADNANFSIVPVMLFWKIQNESTTDQYIFLRTWGQYDKNCKTG